MLLRSLIFFLIRHHWAGRCHCHWDYRYSCRCGHQHHCRSHCRCHYRCRRRCRYHCRCRYHYHYRYHCRCHCRWHHLYQRYSESSLYGVNDDSILTGTNALVQRFGRPYGAADRRFRACGLVHCCVPTCSRCYRLRPHDASFCHTSFRDGLPGILACFVCFLARFACIARGARIIFVTRISPDDV